MNDPIGEIPILITGDWSELEKDIDDAANAAGAGGKEIAAALEQGFGDLKLDLSGSIEASLNGSDIAKQAEAVGEQIGEALKAGVNAEQLSLFSDIDFSDANGQLNLFADSFETFGTEVQNAAKPLAELPKVAGEASAGMQVSFTALAATAATVATAIVGIGAAIGELVLKEGQAAEQMSNLGARLNLSYEDIKKLSDMADIAGVSVEGLTRVSMRLADALEDPTGAGKKVAAALQDIGVNATDSGEALKQLLEKLAEIPDATERISKAHEIMGRGAVQLEPLLRDYTQLKTAVEELGGALDPGAVSALKAADDASDKLGIAWGNLKRSLAADFAPLVESTLNALTKLISAPPEPTLQIQIDMMTNKIAAMREEAQKTTPFLAALFAGAMSEQGTPTVPVSAQGITDAENRLAELQGKQDALARSKDYNDAIDASNAAAKKAAAEAKAAMQEMTEAETAFHNSVVDLYNTFPDTYEEYTQKLADGGKTAKESLSTVEAELQKAISLSGQLTGKPLSDLNEWIVALTKMRDEAKQFADNDAFYKAAQSIQALTEKFPDQMKAVYGLGDAMDTVTPEIAAFFDSYLKGASEVPAALEKIDPVKITQAFLEGQKKLDDAVQKTNSAMETAWLKWEEGADKAAAKQLVITGAVDDTGKAIGDAGDELKNVLPPAIYEAQQKALALLQAMQRLGITASETGETMTASMRDFEVVATDSRTNLEQVEVAWSKVAGQIEKLAQVNLPLALKLQDEFIARLVTGGAALGQIYQQEISYYQKIIAFDTQRGADATQAIENAENLKEKILSLTIASQGLGNVYVGINKAFLDTFDNLSKGITKLIVDGGSVGDMLKGVVHSLETDIVSTFTKGATDGLKKAFIDSGVGQAISGFFTKIFGDVFGGLFKTATTTAPAVAATTANTTALATNTAALGALTSALGGQTAANAAGAAASGASGAGGGAASTLSSLSNIANVVSAVAAVGSGIAQGLQMAHLISTAGLIEVNTRQSQISLHYLTPFYEKYIPQLDHLVDIWAAINTATDELRDIHAILDQIMKGGGFGTGTAGDQTTPQEAEQAHDQKAQDLIDLANFDTQVQQSSDTIASFNSVAQSMADAGGTVTQSFSDFVPTLADTTDSLIALNDAVQEVHGSIPATSFPSDLADLIKSVQSDIYPVESNNSSFQQTGGSPLGSQQYQDWLRSLDMNQTFGNPGFAQQTGAIVNPSALPSGNGEGRDLTVNVTATDNSSREIAKSVTKGLQEIGVYSRIK